MAKGKVGILNVLEVVHTVKIWKKKEAKAEKIINPAQSNVMKFN